MPDNDFIQRNTVDSSALSDLGIVRPSGGSNIGKPGEALGGASPLQELLAQGPPTIGGAVRETLGTKGGVLASLIGGALAGGIGGLEGLAGFVEGTGEAVDQKFAEDLQAYSNNVDLFNKTLESESKARQLIATLFAQTPEAFASIEDLGPHLGVDLEISPMAMVESKKLNANNKAYGDALTELLQQAQTPTTRKVIAQQIFSLYGKDMPAHVVEEYAESGFLKPETIMEEFVNGAEILMKQMSTGQQDLSIGQAKPDFSDSELKEYQVLLKHYNTASQYQKDQAAAGNELSFEAAMAESLDEGQLRFVKLKENDLHPNQTRREFIRSFQQTRAMLGLMGKINEGLFNSKLTLEERTNKEAEIFGAALKAADLLQSQDADAAQIEIYEMQVRAVEKEHPEWTRQQHIDEAIKRTSARLRSRVR